MFRVRNPHAGQITGAIFLIGIGVLLAQGWLWPGILYLLGAIAIVDGTLNGKPLSGNLQGGLFLIGLGLVFSIGFSLPLLFIVLGLMTLFGIRSSRRPRLSSIQDKAKNDWKDKNSEFDQDQEDTPNYRFGDDGELISDYKVTSDQRQAMAGGQQ